MPYTLLTGANSFVGAHVINSLIAAGHHIVGTVRRESLIEELFTLHPEWREHLDLVVVGDYAEEASWDTVFKSHSIDHVGFSLSPCSPHADEPPILDRSRRGTPPG